MVCVIVASLPPTSAGADVKACLDAAEDGQKLRDNGAYRRSRERFIECAADECPGEVRKGCVGWLGELNKLIPTVVFGARAGNKEVADVRVIVDGEVIAERIDGKPIAFDPGEHHFRFERAGETAIDETSVLRAGERERLFTVRFGAEPSLYLPPSVPAEPSGAKGLATEPRVPLQRRVRGLTYAFGAAGVLSLVAGAVLDVTGYAFLQECNGDPSCTGRHERAEVEWRFITGDVLLGIAVLSGVATWLSFSHDSRVAKSQVVQVRVGSLPSGATLGFVATF